MSSSPTRTNGTLPLECYGAIGDGRGVAMVGADGSVDWWCVPNLDSPPLFDRLLDPGGGRFSVTPAEPFQVERRYRPDSNVLEHVFTTASGSARLTDSLNSGISGRLPWCELARRVEGLTGSVAFQIEVRPGSRFDKATSWRQSSPHGDVLHIDGLVCGFRADDAVERTAEDDGGVSARLVTSAGSRSIMALLASSNEPLILPKMAAIDMRMDRSDQSWREWCCNLDISGDYAPALRRSALALKLLLFSPTGAIAAAATTSLPERIGGPKNYDYRLAWVRDVAYSIRAFLHVGATEEAKAAFSWLIATIERHDGHIRTLYRLDGALAPDEAELDLPGYAGTRPVRVGNRARDQLQLGVFGDVMRAAALFVTNGHVLDLTTRRVIATLVDRCADIWRQKDSGIWELEEVEHYTISKVGCWMALNCGATLAAKGQIETSHADRWERERDRIAAWIDAHCWSEAKQSYTMFAGSERLDAAMLLAIPFGFDRRERLALTRDAIRRELCDGASVYRNSGMDAEEATFIACGFWLAEADAILGDAAAATRQMDGMLAACGGNLGLMTEQLDARTGAMLGNVPQALSHLALIHAAVAILDPDI